MSLYWLKRKTVTITVLYFRKLNAVTKKDSYPLPRINDIFDQLSGNARYFTLDFKNGYWIKDKNPVEKQRKDSFFCWKWIMTI